jgi:hypothetical protein
MPDPAPPPAPVVPQPPTEQVVLPEQDRHGRGTPRHDGSTRGRKWRGGWRDDHPAGLEVGMQRTAQGGLQPAIVVAQAHAQASHAVRHAQTPHDTGDVG